MEKRMKFKDMDRVRTTGQKVLFSIAFVIFVLYALSLIFPIIWLFFSSLKNQIEFATGNPLALPEQFLFSNYSKAFMLLEVNDNNFLEMLFNSIWFTIGSAFLTVAVSSLSAYVIAKYKFKGRNFFYGIAIFMMVIPIVGSLPATYKLVGDLGLMNSPLFLLTCTGGFGFNFIVLYGTFKSISWEYAEAAFVDGATHFQVFRKVMLPQAKPTLVSLFIMGAIGSWNDYMTPLLYLEDYPTLASGLYQYEANMLRLANYPVYFAGVLISIIPIVVLFIIFQNTIMENVGVGGLKG